jgi:hypothetical protein
MKNSGCLVLTICVSLWMMGISAFSSMAYDTQESLNVTTPSEDASSTRTPCPTDLSHLQPKMEKVLQFVESASFRKTMLASLQASIPEAIAQADGLAGQIAFLQQEIVRQELEREHAEEVARESLNDPSNPLLPCQRGEEGSYCHAAEQYYVSIAVNLANRAFLDALECYHRKGGR